MKTIALTLTFLLFVLCASAQKNDTLKKLTSDTTIYASAEHLPEFPGGVNQFLNYIAKNIRYPSKARAASKQGKVIVQFIVEKDGSIAQAKVLRSVYPSIDAEAIRVVISSPKWAPGAQDGHAVRVRYTVPISFNIDKHIYLIN